jgi:hypothetical protein
VVPVGDDDAREMLRGQSKVVLACGVLEPLDVVGIYVGKMCIEGAGGVSTEQTMPISDVVRSNSYAYKFTPHEQGVVACTLRELHEREATLVVQPFPRFGNKLMAINDRRGSRVQSNVKFVEFIHMGFPAVAYIATRRIEANEELLADYGQQYWSAQGAVEDVIGAPLRQFKIESLLLVERLERTLRAGVLQ